MTPYAMSLLSRLQRYPALTADRSTSVNIEELMQMYCYSLDLSPFEEGRQVVLYLLQKHKAALVPHMERLPEMLGRHSAKLMELMRVLIAAENQPNPPISHMVATKGNFLSVKDALHKLYDGRQRGDFELAIKGTNKKLRAHSYVLYASWPYFRHMFDANPKEKEQMRLELPGAGQDGGISWELLELIVELCYRPEVLQKQRERVHAALALDVLAIANLYLLDHDGDEQKKSTGALDGLVELAQCQVVSGLTVDVCVEVFTKATEYGLEETAEAARNMIVNNIKILMADPNRRKEIRSLPTDVQLDLLWSCVTKF